MEMMKKIYEEQREEMEDVFEGLYEHLMTYVEGDASVAAAATNLVLHQKAHLRLMATLVEDLRTGRIYKPAKLKKGKRQRKRLEKETQILVNDEARPMLMEPGMPVEEIAVVDGAPLRPSVQQEPIVYVEGESFN